MTRGILDRRDYYYRRLYVDAVRGVETAAAHDRVDPDRIGVAGFSQGGALSLAAAALAPRRASACARRTCRTCATSPTPSRSPPSRRTPSWSTSSRCTRSTSRRVLDTLRYVDNAVLAPRIRASTTVSVGLMDACCPPSTVYAAYNAITAPKRLLEYHYCDHDLPGPPHRGRARGVRDRARAER